MVTLSSLRQQVEAQQGTTGLDSSQVSSIAGSGVAVYETLDSLPSTGLTAGDEAFVKSNYRLYVSNGSGWYNTTLVNRNPRWATEPDASYDIADSATPLIITAKAIDSDNPDTHLTNQSIVSDSAQYMVDISNDSSVWTFTPKSADSIGIEVAAGNLTDSNGDFIYTFKWSDGISFVTKAVTIAYSPTVGGFSWGGDRALQFGGYRSSSVGKVEYFDITTASNASNFGNVNVDYYKAAVSNQERIVVSTGTGNLQLQHVNPATPSQGYTFGNLISDSTNADYGSTWGIIAGSNGTTGIFAGGNKTNTRTLAQQITIATNGNATVFTGTNAGTYRTQGSMTDATRMVMVGGIGGRGTTMDYYTFATQGNAVTFGTAQDSKDASANSSATRGFHVGGDRSGPVSDTIESVIIQTVGNATDFGDLYAAREQHGGTGNATYGIASGGGTGSNNSTTLIQRFNMETGGTGTNHGVLTQTIRYTCCSSGNAA